MILERSSPLRQRSYLCGAVLCYIIYAHLVSEDFSVIPNGERKYSSSAYISTANAKPMTGPLIATTTPTVSNPIISTKLKGTSVVSPAGSCEIG